jgi:hypothetical protein
MTNFVSGLLSGLIATFYLEYYYLSIIFLRETLAIFLLMVFLCCFVEFIKTERPLWGKGAALTFGIGILSRPESALLGILLVLFYLPAVKKLFQSKLHHIALILFLALGPWMIWAGRNAIVHKHFMPFSTDGAWGFYMGQVYHPEEAYTVADPAAMKMIDETPVEYDWYQRMNREALSAMLAHPIRNSYWIPLFVWRNHRYKYAAGLLGTVAALVHLKLGAWTRGDILSLLHIRYSDIVIPGIAGILLMMLQNKNSLWKILAANFLTLILTVILYIAHLRSRLVLCDWILIIGAAHALVELTRWLKMKTEKFSFSKSV